MDPTTTNSHSSTYQTCMYEDGPVCCLNEGDIYCTQCGLHYCFEHPCVHIQPAVTFATTHQITTTDIDILQQCVTVEVTDNDDSTNISAELDVEKEISIDDADSVINLHRRTEQAKQTPSQLSSAFRELSPAELNQQSEIALRSYLNRLMEEARRVNRRIEQLMIDSAKFRAQKHPSGHSIDFQQQLTKTLAKKITKQQSASKSTSKKAVQSLEVVAQQIASGKLDIKQFIQSLQQTKK